MGIQVGNCCSCYFIYQKKRYSFMIKEHDQSGKRKMKIYTSEDVASTIDHAVLKPEMTTADVSKNAGMCIRRRVKSMCVRPCDVAQAYAELKDSPVDVSVVVGFPHGANKTEVKVLETKLACQEGAAEVDMVMNIGRFLSGDYQYVKDEISRVVAEAKKHAAIVKVILETCYLSLEQIEKACLIAREAGAAFVKTSTGFGPGGATPEAVEVMLKTVRSSMQIKASGGIRDWDTAVAFLQQGATRLGVGSTEAVLDGGVAEEDY